MVIVCLNLFTIPRHFYALETKRCLQHANKVKRNTFLNNHYLGGRRKFYLGDAVSLFGRLLGSDKLHLMKICRVRRH